MKHYQCDAVREAGVWIVCVGGGNAIAGGVELLAMRSGFLRDIGVVARYQALGGCTLLFLGLYLVVMAFALRGSRLVR